MAGVSRGRIISAIITAAVLTGLVAGVIVFVSQQDSQRALRSAAQARAAATATATASSATVQFTPAPGITVTVSATPPHGSSSSATTSYTGGSSGGGITTIVPPRYPTPIPTSSASAGGGASPSPTPTAGGSTGGGASPTPTPIPATPTATAAPGPTLIDDAQLIAQSPTSMDSTSYSQTQVSFTMLNTGTSTWDSSQGYALRCVQTCWSWYSPNSSFLVPPGQSHTFIGYMTPMTSYYYGINYSTWQLYNRSVGVFGQKGVISIVNHGWNSVLYEASPSCEGDGAVWTKQSSTGSISCGSSSLVMAAGGSSGAALALTSTPASYDYGNYLTHVHVHFTSTSPTTFAGVVISTPYTGNASQPVFVVSPAGYYCYSSAVTSCSPSNIDARPMPSSSDFDITVYVQSNGTNFAAVANTSPYTIGGGIFAGGATGLIETTVTGSTDAAYFTNYQLYQYK